MSGTLRRLSVVGVRGRVVAALAETAMVTAPPPSPRSGQGMQIAMRLWAGGKTSTIEGLFDATGEGAPAAPSKGQVQRAAVGTRRLCWVEDQVEEGGELLVGIEFLEAPRRWGHGASERPGERRCSLFERGVGEGDLEALLGSGSARPWPTRSWMPPASPDAAQRRPPALPRVIEAVVLRCREREEPGDPGADVEGAGLVALAALCDGAVLREIVPIISTPRACRVFTQSWAACRRSGPRRRRRSRTSSRGSSRSSWADGAAPNAS